MDAIANAYPFYITQPRLAMKAPPVWFFEAAKAEQVNPRCRQFRRYGMGEVQMTAKHADYLPSLWDSKDISSLLEPSAKLQPMSPSSRKPKMT